MDFATNFKRICDEKGVSRTKVCQELGLSTSKVNLWNNGTLPKPDVLAKLAQYLGCQVMDFFADDEEVERNGIELDEDEIDIIRLFRMLSRKEKHEFMSKAYTYEMTMMSRKDDM